MSNYKYTILINQFSVIENGFDLDIIDLALFDYIKDFSGSNSCSKIATPEGTYFWLSHSKIIQDMPLLKIKTKTGIIKRLSNLIKEGIFEKHPNCELYGKTLYKTGVNYDCLIFEKSVNTSKQKFTGGVNQSLDNYSIINNSNYNNTINDNPFAEVSTCAGVDDPNLAGNYPIEIINSTQGGGDVPEGFVIIWEKYDGKKKDLFTEWQRFSDKLEWQPDFNLILNKMPRGNKQPLQSWLNKYTSEPAKTRQIILDVYHNWYLSRNGVKPAINIVDAKGAGELAKYFEQIVKYKEPDLIMSNEVLEENVEKAFIYILSKWNELDAFLQKQVRLQDIANNKTNIINYFKNGKQQTNSNSTAERIKAYKNGFDSIDERFANR